MAYAELARNISAELLDLPFRMKGNAFGPGRLGLELQKTE
jgi:hypothetical protein